MTSCSAGKAPDFPTEAESTPAEDSIGERLFLDTRFAQYFAVHMTGVNQSLAVGDPVLEQVYTMNGTLPGPFAGAIHELPFLPLRHRVPGRHRRW